MNIKKAVSFCEEFIDNHKSSCHIDYLISGDSIKLFFYYKSNESKQYGDLIGELNSSLIKFDLHEMYDFYMKLINVKNSDKYDLCWIFLSFNVTADYYVQRHFRA